MHLNHKQHQIKSKQRLGYTISSTSEFQSSIPNETIASSIQFGSNSL